MFQVVEVNPSTIKDRHYNITGNQNMKEMYGMDYCEPADITTITPTGEANSSKGRDSQLKHILYIFLEVLPVKK